MAFPVHFSARVETIVRHSPDVATYTLLPVGRLPRFKPGHFVHLTLEPYDASSHWPESRVFSIASAPSQKFLRLTIGRQGKYTGRILDEMREGQVLSLKGPYGEFVVAPQEPQDELVLIAGGTGVTPFCSFLEEVALHPEKLQSPVHLCYGARSADQLFYEDLVARAAQASPHIHITYFLETPSAGTRENSVAGRLSTAAILALLPNPAAARYFLSGPRGMIDLFAKELAQKSISQDRIHFDTWE